ncbi:MAG TPA: hypothetical protein VGM90_03265 [Kofleriaceae bacterium]
MRSFEGASHLIENVERFVEVHASALETRVKPLAAQELHRKVASSVGQAPERMHVHDVGMVERCQRLGLATESSECLRI